jgi:hypothetical protein
LQQPVDIFGIAQIAMRQVLSGTKRLQRVAAGGAKVDALREQFWTQKLPQLSFGTRQCDLGHIPCASAPSAAAANCAGRADGLFDVISSPPSWTGPWVFSPLGCRF